MSGVRPSAGVTAVSFGAVKRKVVIGDEQVEGPTLIVSVTDKPDPKTFSAREPPSDVGFSWRDVRVGRVRIGNATAFDVPKKAWEATIDACPGLANNGAGTVTVIVVHSKKPPVLHPLI